MRKLLLSKYYTLNILFYFLFVGNLIYLFTLSLSFIFKHYVCKDFTICVLLFFGNSFKYYFFINSISIFLIILFFLEILLHKINLIKTDNIGSISIYKKIFRIFCMFLASFNFIYFIWLCLYLYAIFDI